MLSNVSLFGLSDTLTYLYTGAYRGGTRLWQHAHCCKAAQNLSIAELAQLALAGCKRKVDEVLGKEPDPGDLDVDEDNICIIQRVLEWTAPTNPLRHYILYTCLEHRAKTNANPSLVKLIQKHEPMAWLVGVELKKGQKTAVSGALMRYADLDLYKAAVRAEA